MIPMNMIDPTPYIKLVDALNELEPVVKALGTDGLGIQFPQANPLGALVGMPGLSLDFQGHYSVQYDSNADRWTLVSETDDAPNLCSFNQTEDECSETDLCEQCYEVAQRMEDESDAELYRRGIL
jgi:hypothetical protein